MRDQRDEVCISHYREGTGDIQTNEEHSAGVANLAADFATDFGMREWGKAAGLLHDKGKEQRAFQTHIRHATGIDTSGHDVRAPHAFAGAIIAHKSYNDKGAGFVLPNIIAGHHRGLYDQTDLEEELKKGLPAEVSADIGNLNLETPVRMKSPTDLSHLTRVLFSCLVDADRLDTERFMTPGEYAQRDSGTSIEELNKLLDERLNAFRQDTPVNKIRHEILRWSQAASQGDRGFYSLTVPTGGGKTLASLSWAMRHAIRNAQRRIIIAIPYTSIIVQTAAILKGIFGERNVLEHHSDVERSDDSEETGDVDLATENWDKPIVVTTNVQLFESAFSNKPAACRKLHNICNSVIILDEVQTLPTDFLQPTTEMLDTYRRLFKCSILFTTASQPTLEGEQKGCGACVHLKGLNKIKEIIPPDADLCSKLKRTTIRRDEFSSSYDDIARRIDAHARVLCIVNTRKDAKEIYDRLEKSPTTFHLSRMMCSAHIKRTIDEIKRLLASDTTTPVKVISTQLIEAGVDIDFPIVYRQVAGLDSIVQAAGRCNREGRMESSETIVFDLFKENSSLPRGLISRSFEALRALGKTEDYSSPEEMSRYFKQLYCRVATFDRKGIGRCYNKKSLANFETIAKNFKLIDDKTTPVIVDYEDSRAAVEEIRRDGRRASLVRRLYKYTVNLRDWDFKSLKDMGAVEEVIPGLWFATSRKQYDENIGLCLTNLWLEEPQIM
ncbi:MAG: CRISPR-associated helicase Cas3' [Marinilabiliaceae bacterium]